MAGVGETVQLLKAVKPRGIRTSHWFAGMLLALLVLCATAAVIWWGAIREKLMDPGISYQTYVPPQAPDYADQAAWVRRPEGGRGAAIFFLHPTTFQGREWNGPIGDPAAERLLHEIMLPNYAGPFADAGEVFIPRYRQSSLYARITLRSDAREARAFAYGDAKRAFDTFLAATPGRPLIVVGVEQGGALASRAVREAIAERPELSERIVALYLIETPIPVADLPLPACTDRRRAGCTIAYLTAGEGEERLIRERLRHAARWRGGALVALRGEPIACVNPLTGAANTGADAERNIGAANASGLEWGEHPGFQARQVSARCIDGVLHVSRPPSPALRGRNGWADSQRVRPYNWFYADLAEDAKARLAGR